MVDLAPGPEAIVDDPILVYVNRPTSSLKICNSPVLNLLRHGQESLFDIGGVLSGGFEEGNTKLVGESLGFRILHNLFSRQIRLVTNQELVDTFNSVSIDFLQPLLNIGVGV